MEDLGDFKVVDFGMVQPGRAYSQQVEIKNDRTVVNYEESKHTNPLEKVFTLKPVEDSDGFPMANKFTAEYKPSLPHRKYFSYQRLEFEDGSKQFIYLKGKTCGSEVQISPMSGSIRSNGDVDVSIAFQPMKIGLFYRAFPCLIENQEPLFVEIIGFHSKSPCKLDLDKYVQVNERLPRYPTNHCRYLADSAPRISPESKPIVSSSRRHINFGNIPVVEGSHFAAEDIFLTNHADKDLVVEWKSSHIAVFKVEPLVWKLNRNGGIGKFAVKFQPNTPELFYFGELWGSFLWGVNNEYTVPFTVTVDVIGDSFSHSGCGWGWNHCVDRTRIVLPGTIPYLPAYATLRISRNGNLPLQYSLRPVDDITLESNAVEQPTEPAKYIELSIEKAHNVSSYLGFVVPLLVSLYYSWARKQRKLLQLLKKHLALSIDVDPILRAINLNEILRTLSLLERLVRLAKQIQDGPSSVIKNTTRPEAIASVEQKSVKCEVLYDPGESRDADVIFIHGIKGALDKTWTQGLWQLASLKVLNLKEEKTWEIPSSSNENSPPSKETKVCWPRDWLPQDLPSVRIISISYTTDPYLWRPFFLNDGQRTGLADRAWEMMNNLNELGVGSRSIIWVGHSKGGLYVKQMLVNACESSEPRFNDFSNQTKAIMFYSVPHRGSILANLNFPWLFRQSIELLEVQKNCQQVISLHKKFLEKLERKELSVTVRSFIETRLTLMGLVYVRIVSEESADAEVGELYGIPLDHRNICKPKSRDCFLYQQLVTLVRETVGDEALNES